MKNILILLSFFLFLSWLEKGRARILAGQKKGLTRAIIRHGKNKIGGKCMKKKKSIILSATMIRKIYLFISFFQITTSSLPSNFYIKKVRLKNRT